jgi:predicted RNase H-like HicB family nuclease
MNGAVGQGAADVVQGSEGMLSEYIQAAMKRARYEILEDQPSDPYYGCIPRCQGVLAVGRTLEECRHELQEALEVWLMVRIAQGLPLPTIDGIKLNFRKVA